MSLRARLAVFIAVTVALAVTAVAFVAYRFAANEARGEIDDFLRGRGPVSGIAQGFEFEEFRGRGGGGRGSEGGILGPLDDIIREDAVAQFIDSSGGIITVGITPIVLPVDEQDRDIAAHGGPDYLRDAEIDGVHFRMLTRPVLPGVAIQVGRDVTATDDILAGLRLRLTLLGLGGVLLTSGAAWLIARRSLRPVGMLTDAAEHVAVTKEFESRIDVDRGDELGRLATSFNGMLAALEEARSSQQRLVADASHELRTPLTSVRTNIELLARGGLDEEDRQELIDDLTSEVGELSHLVAELVDLATIGRDEEPSQDFDLADVVGQAVDRARRRSDIEIELRVEATQLTGQPNGMLRAVTNLLDNAVKWGSEGDSIEVTLADGEFSVRDHGPGIPEADVDRVFERFYRSPEARATPGSGLGLSIVAAVVEEHGGTVFARNAEGGGAVVGFRIPDQQE